MNTKKIIGIILLVGGLVLAILALSADAIGLGGRPGIGLYQILAALVGVVVAVVGYFVFRK